MHVQFHHVTVRTLTIPCHNLLYHAGKEGLQWHLVDQVAVEVLQDGASGGDVARVERAHHRLHQLRQRRPRQHLRQRNIINLVARMLRT